MGKFIPGLISILAPTTKKKERHAFSAKVREEAIRKQKGRCVNCRAYINRWERDFDHKNGDRSNNKLSNCQAMHTSCHRKKHSEKLRNKHSKSFFNLRWFSSL